MGKRAAAGKAGRPISISPQTRSAAARAGVTRAGGASANAPELLERRVLLSTTPATVQVSWNGHTATAVAGEYLVDTKVTAGFDKIADKFGFTAVSSLGGNATYKQFTTTLTAAQITHLAAKYPTVMGTVEPNFVQTLDSTVPDDTYFGAQYALDNTGQDEVYDYNGDGTLETFEQNHYGTLGDDIGTTQAWDITTGSASVVIADLDTGVDLAQPDLAANIYTVPNSVIGQAEFPDDTHGWNFVDDNNDVTDVNGHGTNTAGIIAASGNNAAGVAGVDWTTSLLPVKISNTDSIVEADIVAGINYCTLLKSQGDNIVAMNMSFGSDNFPIDTVEQNALAAAGKVGILAIASAGNDSTDLANTASTGLDPTGTDLDGNLFRTPAKFSLSNSNVITVAAVDNQGNLAEFSNYGASSVEIAAPGVNILSTEPTETTVPVTWTPVDAGNPYTTPYGYLSGTSQAAPFVTGIIGLEAAANPSATPAELKAALLNGAKSDPALASVNGAAPLVQNARLANAYGAVEDILNYHASNDTVHEGDWVGAYGSQGAYVVGDTTAFPSFVAGTFSGGTPVVLQSTTRSIAGLQKPSDEAEHISAYEASAGSESIQLNFTDGAVHQVALYVADLDHKDRSESVELTNLTTGQVLDTQSVTAFTKGEYLIYDLRGDVQLTITNTGGPSAVFSGIFFDAPTTSPATLVGTDTLANATTGATWRNGYGSVGDIIAGDDNLGTEPTDLSGFTTAAAVTTLRSTTKAVVGLNKNADIYHNIEAYWSAATSFDVNVTFDDTLLHQVTLYAADYDHRNRSERIEALNSAGALLAYQDLSAFTKGEYVTFDVTGTATFRVIDLSGPSAVLSGVFFDNTPGENAAFQGVDTTTQGNWQQAGYGGTAAFIAGDSFPEVDTTPLTNAIISDESNLSESVVQPLSGDSRALERLENPSTRVEAYLYATTTMSFEVNFNATTSTIGAAAPLDQQQQLALYFADYQGLNKRGRNVGTGRNENLTITDVTTGAVLVKQKIFNFQSGKYFVYNVNGPVIVTISSAAGNYPNAVLSGVFVG